MNIRPNTFSRPFFVLLAILTLWPHHVHTASEINGADLINKACQRALYKDLCKSSLQTAPETTQATNVHDLARIALNLALSNAKDIYNHIKEMLNATTEDSFAQQCLEDCSDNYQDAIDQLDDSLAALSSNGYSDVNMWVSAAMSDADSCENGFKDQPAGHNSPLINRSKNFSQLCSNVLAIINQLAGISS